MTPGVLRPVVLKKEGEDRLVIEWNDGHRSDYCWTHLRKNVSLRRLQRRAVKPADPFRILKPSEIGPLKPVSISPSATMPTRSSGATATTRAFSRWSICVRCASARECAKK